MGLAYLSLGAPPDSTSAMLNGVGPFDIITPIPRTIREEVEGGSEGKPAKAERRAGRRRCD